MGRWLGALRSPVGFVVVTSLGLTLAACSDSSGPGAGPVKVGTPVDPATAGSIHVEVRYDGPVPQRKEISMGSAPQCAAAHSQPVLDPSLLVKDGKLANAVVWIKKGLESWVFATPTTPAHIDQKGCMYEPRVVTAMVGQPVEFRNSDPEAHNVHGRPAILKGWNFMMNRQGSTRTLTFDKPEVAVSVGCDIHPWMGGFVAVVPNPYAEVTPESGAVVLRNVPPGEYTVGVWHEKLGSKEQVVQVPNHGDANLSVTLSPAS